MVNLEENMTNLKDSETRFTVGDSRTLTGKKCGDWHGYQRRDGKLHRVMLSNTYVIPGLYENNFRAMQALQNVFQVTSEGKPQSIIKIQLRFALMRK